jgi:hypothetical protein
MHDLQKGKTMIPLLHEALAIARERGVEGPDRIARRYRLGMLCWFCDNASELLSNQQQVGPIVTADDPWDWSYEEPDRDDADLYSQ